MYILYIYRHAIAAPCVCTVHVCAACIYMIYVSQPPDIWYHSVSSVLGSGFCTVGRHDITLAQPEYIIATQLTRIYLYIYIDR